MRWRQRKWLEIYKAGYRCQRCGTFGTLEVHHKNYDNLGHENDEDLEVVCRPCHEIADAERKSAMADDLWVRRVMGWAQAKYGDTWVFKDFARLEDEFYDFLDDIEGL